ncbi:MAG: DUF3857 and transglutaminase domain-containing protein [Phycisphaerae bacterium]|nr:DUF3857 and transglutaminase domain-containing protein [Phycisphaerae bacterium]NUQ45184.1 DUF3857 and transglutaminase domain-containing protein [Phycisphaerae bacterium]
MSQPTVLPLSIFRCATASLAALLTAACALPAAAAARDDDVRARLANVGDAQKYDADVVVVLDETDVTVRPNGIGEARTRRIVKVLRDGGVRNQSVHRFDFDPTTNTLELKRVRVHRADGATVDVPVASAVQQPEPQWGIYWGSRQLMVSVPRLSIGDAVETEFVKTGFNVAYLRSEAAGAVDAGGPSLEPPMPGHWYDEVNFYSSVPIIEKRYVVRMPKDKPLQFEVYNGEVRTAVTFEGTHVVYTFEKRDIMPFKGEPHMPSARDTECKLVLATLEDWKKKSRWFHEKNEPSFAVDDDIRARTRAIIASCRSDEEKITALNHWVAENIRYIGTSRGACEGYTTHAVTETFRDRGGVCKDKAGMLVAMLREAGFDSYIVMTQAGTDVAPIPADQFNHAVTCIRKPDGSFRLLDPTWMPKSRENWSSAEQLQYVVYGTPQGEELTRSPYSGPEENCLTWEARSRLADDNSLNGSLSFTAEGAPETALRRSLARFRPQQRSDFFDDTFGALAANALLRNTQAMDAVDFSGPLGGRFDFAAAHYALGDGERRVVSLPMLRLACGTVLSDLINAASAETRKYPLRLRSTRRVVLTESIALPRGWTASDGLREAVRLDGPAAAVRFEMSKSGDGLRYECQVDLKKHVVPSEDYAGFRGAMKALEEIGKYWVKVTADTTSAKL